MNVNGIPPLPVRLPFLDGSGLVTPVWLDWFEKVLTKTGSNSTDQLGTSRIADGAISFVKLLAADWTNSKTANGYQKLPSGVYAQWGNVSVPVASEASAAITFPVEFPTECLQVYACPIVNASYASTETGLWGVTGPGTSGFTIHNRTTASLLFTWLAIGH